MDYNEEDNIDIEDIKSYLIEALCVEEQQDLNDLEEMIGFSKDFICYGLKELEDEKIVISEYKILRQPTGNAVGLATRVYSFDPLWRETYSVVISKSGK